MPEPSATSLIPIVITLSLSLYTRNVIIGLFSGVFAGVLMLHGFNPFTGLSIMVTDHIVPELTDSYNAGVLVLLLECWQQRLAEVSPQIQFLKQNVERLTRELASLEKDIEVIVVEV